MGGGNGSSWEGGQMLRVGSGASWSADRRVASSQFDMRRAHLGTTTKAGSHANRNAGFIRQAGEWHWGCRMNPAFRWWCQDAPTCATAGFLALTRLGEGIRSPS